jgi:aminopeptidase N
MRTETPKTIYLKDYKPYPYTIEHIDLDFDLRPEGTIVTASTQFKRQQKEKLFLNGEDLELLSLKIDGHEFTVFEKVEGGIILPALMQEEFTLEIVTKIYPDKNTRLEGLYMSGGNYCTQCEAEGFRRITYYPDRPDVMTTFTTRIQADKKAYPVLLSNGNLVEKGDAGSGRHYTVWNDPFPKPCYLFALVAGNLAEIHDTYTTGSGRKVDLYIYVRHGDESQCDWAMGSLKRSMKWDEDTYGLEYDLNIFNIVAVSDFNMGAMENKSLNIFNTALVLAQQGTATDGDFMRVESVIGHEYFHNWSGNRVTCRDWFQLSLKEGLTVFRDQEFSSDLHSRAVQRIDDVMHLRCFQFSEDAGPLAHPIRPDNYIEINNFYTMTVYEKGAEVIRMMRTILGPEKYRKGTDLYFKRYDGHAATCDDFVQCMQEASGIDLSHFKLWYSQAGTPEVSFKGKYDAAKKTYTVELAQSLAPTPGQPDKKPLFIPVSIGLLNDNGDDIAQETLHLMDTKQSFEIKNVASEPVPSVLRNFSAPVKLKSDVSNEQLAFLMVHDSDGFNRWEAGQTFALRTIQGVLDGKPDTKAFLKSYGDLLEQKMDKALLARALSLPSVSAVIQEQTEADPVKIYKAVQELLTEIRETHGDLLLKLYQKNRSCEIFSLTPQAMGQRALQNTLLNILDNPAMAVNQYNTANNMTDRVAALSVLAKYDSAESNKVFEDFYKRFKDYQLVIDKWFALQAGAVRPDIISVMNDLRKHPDFNIKNPNRARSLFSAFALNNPVSFHAADGLGYDFLTEAVLELNDINPQIAARLLTPMREWKRYTQDRQEKMKACLQKIVEQPKLSPDVYEIASKSLKA